MNAQGFGVTETSKGEVMAYEPASLNKDGSVPAYERGRDWPVSAETLKNRYDLDVTHNWFEQNTPKELALSRMETLPCRMRVWRRSRCVTNSRC